MIETPTQPDEPVHVDALPTLWDINFALDTFRHTSTIATPRMKRAAKVIQAEVIGQIISTVRKEMSHA